MSYSKNGLLRDLPTIENELEWPWNVEVNPIIYDDKITWPKLTIVTPSYNQGAFLEQTIRSVLLQNYPNLEYIVIDGGSDDNSIEILKKYSRWLSYWQSEKDNGQGHAINLGFSLASGNYYSWINSDDFYTKGTFLSVINIFRKNKYDFIYGYALNYNVTTGEKDVSKPWLISDSFIRIPTLAQPSCFWDSKIHQPIWELLHCSLDYELWLRMIKGKRKKLIKEVLSVASIHENAKTSDKKMAKHWAHDHDLICSNDAHGPVYNWNRLVVIKRFLMRLNNLF